jgi:hypothetical protein
MAGVLPAAAQTFQFGVIGGLTATDPDPFGHGESKRYMIGPSVEARFFGGKLGVELSAIYRRFGNSFAGEFGPPPSDYEGPAPVTRFYGRSRANSWEFPLLGKYYFRNSEANWRPFLGAGYSLRMQWWESKSTLYFRGSDEPQNSRTTSESGPDIGAVAVAGVELRKFHRLSFQPQVRYTRWANHSSSGRSLNQVDVGLGIRF